MLDTDSTDQPQTTDSDAPRRPAPRKRAPRKATAAAGPPPVDAVTPDAPVDATSAGDTPAAPAPRKRAPRKTAAKAAPAPEPTAETAPTEAATADPTTVDPTDADPTDAGAAAPARKTARRTRSRATAADTAAVGEAAAAPDDAAALPAAGSEADGSVGTVPAAALEFTAPAAAPAKRATRKRAAKKTAATADPAEQAVADEAAVAADTDPATDPDGSDAPVAPGVLFVAPAADAPAPRRRRAAKKTAAPADPAEETPATLDAAAAVEPDTETDTDEVADPDDVREAAIEQANGARRRRRRGRRGRGGVARSEDTDETGEDDTDDVDADGETDDADPDAGDESGEQSATSRRRRRRRRSGTGGDGSGEGTDDPPNTVVHVRDKKARSDANAAGDDGVRGIKGSTRLEAKRQRRRDGRDTTRRRAPILTEAEFLARREAVDRVMAVRQNGDRTQIAVLEDDILVEHYVTRASSTSYVGNVYLGRVQNVLPSMEAAFVDIGKGRNGVLYAGEVNWDAAGLDGKSRTIEHAMKSGDPVLVQVTKDPIGHKGARLTSQVSLPGRFVVYVPGGGMTGISRRLPDAERHRLKSILKKIVPDEAGVIVRTAAEGASEEDLTHDVERLQAQWEQIQSKAEQKKSAPVLLHGEPDLAIRVVRDVFNEDFKSLVVQGAEAWDTVSDYLGGVAPDLAERASKHVGNRDLFHELRVDEQLMKALDRKVWLPSGGSLVIDRTEAMTVIDVNTGKFVGSGGNLEQTVTRNNLEAAEEIVRQLRLRDVGGIVVIDFIDMVLESNRELVLRRLTECLGRDRTKHQVAEVTSLGLVQMTRKRVGEGLLEAFSEPCEHCHGRGVLVHQEPVEQKSGSSSDDDERSSGRGKRRRGGKSGATNEPVEAVEPPMTDEQRQAANAAIAAIHKAAALEKAEAGETTDHGIVATLATDLVAAARQADTPAEAQPATAPEAAAAPEVPSEPEPEAALDAPSAEQGPDVPAVELEAAAVAEGPTSTDDDGTDPDGTDTDGTDTGGTDAGAGSAAPAPRRRRRAASRPAGPPVLTP